MPGAMTRSKSVVAAPAGKEGKLARAKTGLDTTTPIDEEDVSTTRFDLGEFREHFAKCDRDRSGYVDYNELKTLFIEMGLIDRGRATDAVIMREIARAEEFFHDEDESSENLLSYCEFLVYCRRLWDWWEKQGPAGKGVGPGGKVSFFAVLKEDPKRTREMFMKYCKDSDLSRDQRLALQVEDSIEREMVIRDLFHSYDKDNSGFIDASELEALVVDMGIMGRDSRLKDRVKELIAETEEAADDLVDNRISFQEFVHLYNKLIDTVKMDEDRAEQHEVVVKQMLRTIAEEHAREAGLCLSTNVNADQPKGWSGYGGKHGVDEVVEMWEQNKKEFAAIRHEHGAFDMIGKYTTKTPTMDRTIYMYRQEFEYLKPREEEWNAGHLVVSVQEGTNLVCELIYHTHIDLEERRIANL